MRGEPRLERAHVRRSFDRASTSYEAAAVLQSRVRAELIERLALVALEPRTVLDLGCGTGQGARELRRRFPRARVIALDLSPGMLREARRRESWRRRFDRVCADGARLPLRPASVDLVVSNLMLPWAVDLDAQLAELRRVLAPRGCLSFSTLGPDTLRELREAFAEIDGAAHVHPFFDLHDIGDALVRAGFADPVMDVDRLSATYAGPEALIGELRGLGATNALATRPRSLAGRARRARLMAALERRRGPNGRLAVSGEVVYGQAWCPGTAPPIRGRRGEVVVPIGSIRRR